MSRNEHGFTLIELLVSLAILSIALTVLLGTISGALSRARQDRNEMLAASLVQSLLARAESETLPRGNEADGSYSNGFRWQILVHPYGDGSDTKAWSALAYIVKASVSWNDGSQMRTRELVGLHIVPPPKQEQ